MAISGNMATSIHNIYAMPRAGKLACYDSAAETSADYQIFGHVVYHPRLDQ
ncbi:hypothetical protein GCM10007053_18610 [Halioglobus pacificus]|uniref:Uncharacterized protein n=1 Tax=Parahalioglobus pacificus TaxID=930806 RepID=A0A918XIC0_9GAMM|nr:hypothetical protein GCM10007053_18610 [Halioglobus pacificus]